MRKIPFYVETSVLKGTTAAPQTANSEVHRLVFDKFRQNTTPFDTRICCSDGSLPQNHLLQSKKSHVKFKKLHFTWKAVPALECKCLLIPSERGWHISVPAPSEIKLLYFTVRIAFRE